MKPEQGNEGKWLENVWFKGNKKGNISKCCWKQWLKLLTTYEIIQKTDVGVPSVCCDYH